MKGDALRLDLGLEHLNQVPADALSLAVLVCGQQQAVGGLERLFKPRDVLALVVGDHVQGRKVFFDVDPQARPLLFFVLFGDLFGLAGKITDVAVRGLDDVIVTQKTRDGLGLGRRLDDD